MACIDDARTLYWTDPTFPWLHSVYVSIAWYERGFDRGEGKGPCQQVSEEATI